MRYHQTRAGFCTVPASILSVIFLCSCANMADSTRTQTEAAATGAAVGAVFGQLAGGSKESTALGAIIGAAIGGAVGNRTAEDKARYAQMEEQLKAVIVAAEQTTQQARASNGQLAKEILVLKRHQETLLAIRNLSASKKRTLLANQQKIEKLIEKTTTDIAAIDQRLADQRKILEEQRQLIAAKQAPATSNLMTVALTKVSALDSEREVMVSSLDQLRQIDQRRAY